MSYQDFKDALMNFAGYVIEHQMVNVLIFAINFQFKQPEEESEWRKKEYFPRIKKVGDIKQAIVMQKEHLQYVKDEVGSTAIVPTRYFSSEDEATAWLNSAE
jgi:hypothetical protein